MKRVMALVLVLALPSAAAGASPDAGLAAEKDINAGLFVIVVADHVRKECDSIDARLWRAYVFIEKLKSKARERGYARAQVEAYLDDEDEQAKMDWRRNAYFEANDASADDPQSLCRLGRAEIARNSQIGHLLKAE